MLLFPNLLITTAPCLRRQAPCPSVTGTVPFAGMRERGITSQAIIGYLAHLAGQVEAGEYMNAFELLDIFDATRVPKDDVQVDLRCLEGPHCVR